MKNKCALEIILDVMIRVTEIVGGIFTLMMPVCVCVSKKNSWDLQISRGK